jgi:peptidoglycan/xylan/chitin deacetylase (PgdA/CDA1 family)
MNKCRGLHVLLGLCVAGAALAAEVQRPYVKIARFKGNADCAVSLTFDDAFPSQIEKALPIFDKHGLHATFFVHTDNVKDSWASTWDAWRAAAATGHEVGSHTKTHPDLTQIRTARKMRNEVEGSADLIEQRLGIRPISFAYPFSAANDSVERQVREVYLLDRSDCRMWGGEGFGADTGIGNIEQAAEKGVWFYCMMHGIDEVSFRPITATALAGIAEYLAEHRDTIWTDTYGNVGRYVRERTLAEFKFRDVTKSSFEMRLSLVDDVPFLESLTMPLTLMVALDGRDGKLVKAYRGDEPVPVTVSRDGKYVLLDVVPRGEWIQVFWGN